MRLINWRISLRVKALLGVLIPLAALFVLLTLTDDRSFASIGLGLVALSAIILFGVNNYFIAPLNRLSQATALVDDGEFEAPVALRRNDEFGDLAGSIADMTNRLRQHSQDLRQRVGELTLLHNISKVTSSAVNLDH